MVRCNRNFDWHCTVQNYLYQPYRLRQVLAVCCNRNGHVFSCPPFDCTLQKNNNFFVEKKKTITNLRKTHLTNRPIQPSSSYFVRYTILTNLLPYATISVENLNPDSYQLNFYLVAISALWYRSLPINLSYISQIMQLIPRRISRKIATVRLQR